MVVLAACSGPYDVHLQPSSEEILVVAAGDSAGRLEVVASHAGRLLGVEDERRVFVWRLRPEHFVHSDGIEPVTFAELSEVRARSVESPRSDDARGTCERCLAPWATAPQPIYLGDSCPIPSFITPEVWRASDGKLERVETQGLDAVSIGRRIRLDWPGACACTAPDFSATSTTVPHFTTIHPPEDSHRIEAIAQDPDGTVGIFAEGYAAIVRPTGERLETDAPSLDGLVTTAVALPRAPGAPLRFLVTTQRPVIYLEDLVTSVHTVTVDGDSAWTIRDVSAATQSISGFVAKQARRLRYSGMDRVWLAGSLARPPFIASRVPALVECVAPNQTFSCRMISTECASPSSGSEITSIVFVEPANFIGGISNGNLIVGTLAPDGTWSSRCSASLSATGFSFPGGGPQRALVTIDTLGRSGSRLVACGGLGFDANEQRNFGWGVLSAHLGVSTATRSLDDLASLSWTPATRRSNDQCGQIWQPSTETSSVVARIGWGSGNVTDIDARGILVADWESYSQIRSELESRFAQGVEAVDGWELAIGFGAVSVPLPTTLYRGPGGSVLQRVYGPGGQGPEWFHLRYRPEADDFQLTSRRGRFDRVAIEHDGSAAFSTPVAMTGLADHTVDAIAPDSRTEPSVSGSFVAVVTEEAHPQKRQRLLRLWPQDDRTEEIVIDDAMRPAGDDRLRLIVEIRPGSFVIASKQSRFFVLEEDSLLEIPIDFDDPTTPQVDAVSIKPEIWALQAREKMVWATGSGGVVFRIAGNRAQRFSLDHGGLGDVMEWKTGIVLSAVATYCPDVAFFGDGGAFAVTSFDVDSGLVGARIHPMFSMNQSIVRSSRALPDSIVGHPPNLTVLNDQGFAVRRNAPVVRTHGVGTSAVDADGRILMATGEGRLVLGTETNR